VKEFRARLGQIVLVERVGAAAAEPFTGVVLESPATSVIALDLMTPPTADLHDVRVQVSVFAPEAMYRAVATLRLTSGHRAHLEDVEAEEPVQRRRWPRQPIALPVSLVPVDDVAPAGIMGETIDISVGGVKIVTQQPLPPGSDPLVAITLPDGDVLLMLGRVVHTSRTPDAFTYGVVFPDIDGDDAARLSEVVAVAACGTA
jgi:hypothetical protein